MGERVGSHAEKLIREFREKQQVRVTGGGAASRRAAPDPPGHGTPGNRARHHFTTRTLRI
jgi:hypothetical protein